MKHYKLFIIILGLTSVYFACKKDEGAVADNITGIWKPIDGYIVTFDTIKNKDSIFNTFQSLKQCEKDDLIRFNDENKLFFEMYGNDKCDPAEPGESLRGNWSIVDKSKILRIISTDFSDTIDYNLLYLDKTTLKLSMENDTIANSSKYFTYERKE